MCGPVRNSLVKVMNGSNTPDADPGSTATSLITGVRALEPGAWRQLATLYGPLIYGWARRAGLRDEDAADVTQDVFRAVAIGAPHFRHGRQGDTFRGWLWTITRNKLHDFRRRHAEHPLAAGGTDALERLLLVAEDDSGNHVVSPAEAGGLVSRAVELVRAEFEQRSWNAFWQVTVEGRVAADVARDLGMTTNAVYVARSRILRRLRDLLGEDAPHGAADRPASG